MVISKATYKTYRTSEYDIWFHPIEQPILFMSLKEFKHEDITRITHVTKPVTSKIDDDEYQQVKTLIREQKNKD